MSWRTLTIQEVMAELSPAEQSQLQAVGGVAAMPPSILFNAIAEARSAARAGGNQLDNTGSDQNGQTVDDLSRPHVIASALWRWITSTPELEGVQSKQRENKFNAAQKYYQALSSQSPDRPRTELPANVDATPVPLIQPSIGEKKLRHFKPSREDGIV